jgi:uncharacterized OB-fold protein
MSDDLVFADGLVPSPLDRDTEPFWEAAKEHRLTYQTCHNCGHVVFFARQHCPVCLGRDLTWHDSSGCGTVYPYSVVRASRDPRFADRVPYAVAWVDLDEGFRMMSNVLGDVDALRVGTLVEVRWATSGEWQLPVFEPRGAA